MANVEVVVSSKLLLANPAGEILVLRKQNGFWDIPGGKREFLEDKDRWETPEETVRRESWEETGIDSAAMTLSGIAYTHVVKGFKGKEPIIRRRHYFLGISDREPVWLTDEHNDLDYVQPYILGDRLDRQSDKSAARFVLGKGKFRLLEGVAELPPSLLLASAA